MQLIRFDNETLRNILKVKPEIWKLDICCMYTYSATA